MATINFTLKLWIDKKANRVLFAEASKDFVDFLLSLLTLPVGSVIKLLTTSKMLGCIGNLYESVENLSNAYVLQSNKSLLLNPRVAVASSPLDVSILTADEVMRANTYYTCSFSGSHQSSICFTSGANPCAYCPGCHNNYLMTAKANYVACNSTAAAIDIGKNGYVKDDAVAYMVMDDLSVKPLSAISLTSLLNVENLNSVEERVVDLGMEEGLELLRLSLHSKTALSEVFLVKKEKK